MTRDLQAVRRVVASVHADVSAEPRVSLREINARCRLRDANARLFNDPELRELLELELSHSRLPEGAAGEACLAYLVAMRKGLDPVSAAINGLRMQGANDAAGRQAVADWLDKQGRRQLAQGAALEAELAARGHPNEQG